MNKLRYQRPLRIHLCEDDVLFFLHIPKTAGLSLISYLDSHFADKEIFPLHSAPTVDIFSSFEQEALFQYRLVRGHYRFGPFDERVYANIVQNPIMMTILRDPVARTISAYRQFLRDPEAVLHDELVSKGLSLKEYVCDPNYAHRVVNRQTRMIVGAYRSQEADEITCRKLSDEALLRVAMQNLEQFVFFGLTERFEESLHLLAYTFGWTIPSEMPEINVSPRPSARDSVSVEDIEAIEERSRLDLRLYRFAERMFEQRLNQMTAESNNNY